MRAISQEHILIMAILLLIRMAMIMSLRLKMLLLFRHQ